MMASEYNFFRLNQSGVVDTVKLVKLSDDDAAIAHARAMDHPGQIEIWSGRRRIAVVPPLIDRRAADQRTTH